ncbi:sensor histidine kinase [Paenibacillus radicis (ex Xue et al. 2023)]|uniref:Histidine kinase n=1 Tax=Paenibacillus radicis (ex Xue et al. 2023) TaxID=2972489 RepID=A0ABT1YNU4_9BACL|nr:sensor histidine kinase [Paenibacillus radicis (ex Xue et al. 2023)]MCR8634839.1 histidine kinase [Paenibacillus radicis (ex Xue et al. 2023)]
MNLSTYKIKTIRVKLILIFTVFFLLPFILFGSIWYQRSTQLIEENAIASAQKSIQQANSYLTYYFGDLERITLPYITHPLIEAFMKITPDEVYQRFSITTQIQNQIINQVIYGKKEVYGLSIISENGIVVSNLADTMEGWGNRDLIQLEPRDDRNIKFNHIHWENGIPILTISRKFTDTNTYSTKGLMLIDLRLNVISAFISKIGSSQTGFTWIADGEGSVVLHPDPSRIGDAVPDWYNEHIRKMKQGSLIVEDSGVKKLIVFEHSPLTEWTLVSEVPLTELTGDLFALRNITLLILIAVTLVSLFFIGGFALSLTNSLSNLKRLMKRAGSGEMFVRAHVPPGKQDELNELYDSFNQMVEKLQRSIDEVHASELREKELMIKQREIMLKSMQAQINPHFLYNTLEVINSYAILENVMPISRMAISLASLFRYSITSGDERLSLYEEMQHIQTYFEIQKERFEFLTVKMQFSWDDLRQVQALRLTLQPLVENVFRHAYEKHERYPEFVALRGERTALGYHLFIIDRGGGMVSSDMEKLNQAFQSVKDTEYHLPGRDQDEENRWGNVGLWNVHQRLRLSFGEPYGIHILKSTEKGTWIEVHLPVINGGT